MKKRKGKDRREPPPPPGGRALERLRQFERERGLEETEIEPTQPSQPAEDEKTDRPSDECP